MAPFGRLLIFRHTKNKGAPAMQQTDFAKKKGGDYEENISSIGSTGNVQCFSFSRSA